MERRRRSVTESAESVFLNILASFFVRKLVGLSDGIVCVSNRQRQILVENLPSIADKTKVIYNPLPALQPVGIREDDFGYFGGPSYSKGFVVLLRALSLLRRSSLTVHATSFSGSQVLEDSLISFGIKTYSRLGQSELGELFQRIRGVLVPSVVVESSPYVVSEALLRARVVVASKIGGIPEMVDGCRGVLLFTPGNSRELAEKIAYTSDLRREVATDLGLSNRETYMSRFNNEKTIRDFLELSHNLLGES
jgi:glycosyltransferase involved in cell wall biosynthesis